LAPGVVSKGEGDMSYLASEYGVKPTVIPELGRELGWKNDLITLFKLFQLIKSEKPSIIHTHTAKAGTLCEIQFQHPNQRGFRISGFRIKWLTKVYGLRLRINLIRLICFRNLLTAGGVNHGFIREFTYGD
jgi:hypothetical protein